MSSIKLIIKLSFQVLESPVGPYMVYVFGKGTFVNNGDGGFHNFCCKGKYTKSGNRYMFSAM